MDPVILSQAGPWAVAISLLIAGMAWIASRLSRAEDRAEARATEAQRHCDEERSTLTAKVDKLEDRIAELYEDTVNRSTKALEETAMLIRRSMDR